MTFYFVTLQIPEKRFKNHIQSNNLFLLSIFALNEAKLGNNWSLHAILSGGIESKSRSAIVIAWPPSLSAAIEAVGLYIAFDCPFPSLV